MITTESWYTHTTDYHASYVCLTDNRNSAEKGDDIYAGEIDNKEMKPQSRKTLRKRANICGTNEELKKCQKDENKNVRICSPDWRADEIVNGQRDREDIPG